MGAMKLSILIATMPSRIKEFDELMIDIQGSQSLAMGNGYIGQVEVLFDNSMQYNIGVKRNKLLSRAMGEYVVFIDDDDCITRDYVHKILVACDSGADAIGISGTMTTNGTKEKQWHISRNYLNWFERNGIYFRTPNHISPVKRALALKAGFPELKHGEDYEYSMRLIPLIKTECVVPGNIYWYNYKSNK